MKTITELRAAAKDKKAGVVGLSRALYPLCTAGRLVERLQLVNTEIREVEEQIREIEQLQARKPADGEPTRPTTVASRGEHATQLAELRQQLATHQAEHDVIAEQMNDHLSPVLLTAKPSDEWLDWLAAHPPREDDDRDIRALCNFDDLIRDLAEHVAEVSGEPVADLDEGDVDFLLRNTLHGDKVQMVWLVLQLQNGTVRVPKSLTSSSDDPTSSAG